MALSWEWVVKSVLVNKLQNTLLRKVTNISLCIMDCYAEGQNYANRSNTLIISHLLNIFLLLFQFQTLPYDYVHDQNKRPNVYL
jgi:hypothetical protein